MLSSSKLLQIPGGDKTCTAESADLSKYYIFSDLRFPRRWFLLCQLVAYEAP